MATRSRGLTSFVMAGHSRLKDGVACARLCRPSTSCLLERRKTWMPGARPGLTGQTRRLSRAAIVILPARRRIRPAPGCHKRHLHQAGDGLLVRIVKAVEA